MATLSQGSYFTIVDLAKQTTPDGNIAIIAETLAELNELLATGVMAEANQSFSDVGTKRIKLPSVSPRKINSGTEQSLGQTAQVREGIVLLDALITIDEAIVDHAPDPAQVRRNVMAEQLEAYMQEFSRICVYGDESVDAKEINGFFTRKNSLSDEGVFGAGGTGSDLSSILLVEWNPITTRLIYPKGSSTVGITEEDFKKRIVYDSSNNPFVAYVNQVKMEFGLSALDDRGFARIANLETSGDSYTLTDTTNHVMRLLVSARNYLRRAGKNAYIYVNRTIKAQFDNWALEKSNGFYTVAGISGEPLTNFQGIPVKMLEQITDTETELT